MATIQTKSETEDQPARCAWARTSLSIAYHDLEWGVPVHDDKILFEFLTLEGAQAGLSWETILKKRDAYRQAFAGFDATKVATFKAAQVARLLENPGIVRNRLKIGSTVGNAKAFLAVRRELGSFDSYVWSFVGGTPRMNRWRTSGQVPARTPQSDALSRDLLSRGFKFVGSTICYAFMQAVGMVNDHTIDCFRYERAGTLFVSADDADEHRCFPVICEHLCHLRIRLFAESAAPLPINDRIAATQEGLNITSAVRLFRRGIEARSGSRRGCPRYLRPCR